jgi:hypothetical protein
MLELLNKKNPKEFTKFLVSKSEVNLNLYIIFK